MQWLCICPLLLYRCGVYTSSIQNILLPGFSTQLLFYVFHFSLLYLVTSSKPSTSISLIFFFSRYSINFPAIQIRFPSGKSLNIVIRRNPLTFHHSRNWRKGSRLTLSSSCCSLSLLNSCCVSVYFSHHPLDNFLRSFCCTPSSSILGFPQTWFL